MVDPVRDPQPAVLREPHVGHDADSPRRRRDQRVEPREQVFGWPVVANGLASAAAPSAGLPLPDHAVATLAGIAGRPLPHKRP